MAGTTTHPTVFRTTVADLVTSTLSTTAKLNFRATGSANSPGTAVATLAMSNPVAPGASSGVLTFSTITSDTNAAGGTIATATLETGGGTVVVHCTVGTSGDAINVSSGGLTVTAGDTVSCSSLTYTAMP
jgi:hypothetical protein